MKTPAILVLCLLALATTLTAAPITILSNLPSNYLATGNVDNVEQRGVTFTIKDTPLIITGVQLGMENYISLTDVALLSIHTNDSNKPGSQIGSTFTSPTSSSDAPDTFNFTSTGISLAANTTYWIVIKGSTSEAFSWTRSDPTVTPASTAYASFGNQWISQNSGETWSIGSNGAHSFAITATAPEPHSTALLLMAAILGGVILRKYKKTSQQP